VTKQGDGGLIFRADHNLKAARVQKMDLRKEMLWNKNNWDGDEYFDEDIVGSMITSVKDLLVEVFVKKDKSEKNIALYKFEFGERRIILKIGEHFFIAIVLLGTEDKPLLSKSEVIIRDIEEKYGSVLNEWDGFLDDFIGVDEIILKLFPMDKLSEMGGKEVQKEEKKVFNLWSKMWHSLMQGDLMPKPHIWKNLKWKPIIDDEKCHSLEGEEVDSQEVK